MIKELIKLANQLDQIGLDRYSDKVDSTISRLKKEAQFFNTPTPGSTATELFYDAARMIPVTSPIAYTAEGLYDTMQGKTPYEAYVPHLFRSVEDYMERKKHYIGLSRASISAVKADVISESNRLSSQDLKNKISYEIDSLDPSWFLSISNFYRNMEAICPKIYQLAWAIGYKNEPKPSKDEVGLSFVTENLTSRTTSWFDANFSEAGYWIMWQVIKEGWSDGEAEFKRTSPPPSPSPAPVIPRPIPHPHPNLTPTKLRHPVNSVLSEAGWTYIVKGEFEFDWKKDVRSGNFTPATKTVYSWNQAADIINRLTPLRPGETETNPPVKETDGSLDDAKNNVKIILEKVNGGANFALGTLQNEKRRLRELLDGGSKIDNIAQKIVNQNGDALIKSSLASAKQDALRAMSNSDIRRAYRKELDLIMSTINTIFKA